MLGIEAGFALAHHCEHHSSTRLRVICLVDHRSDREHALAVGQVRDRLLTDSQKPVGTLIDVMARANQPVEFVGLFAIEFEARETQRHARVGLEIRTNATRLRSKLLDEPRVDPDVCRLAAMRC